MLDRVNRIFNNPLLLLQFLLKFLFFQSCNCSAKTAVATFGQIITHELKTYESGVAYKVSIESGEKTFHTCIFENTPLFGLIQNFEIGDEITFKAVITKSDERHDLGRIFHIKNYK